MWRLAKSLERLRDQVNARFPNRNKRSDGTIGDAAHRSRESDHNPWVRDGSIGVVTALDLTHDLRVGLDTWAMAEHLRRGRDPRIKYVISNKRIFSSTTSAWNWRHYTGSNPHSSHIHVSVNSTRARFDDTGDWNLGWGWDETLDTSPQDPNAPDPDSPTLRPILRRGLRGDDVRTVQRLLMLDQTSIFGPLTEAAVRAFQKREKLIVDGIVGPATWGKLDLIEQTPVPFNYEAPHPLSETE